MPFESTCAACGAAFKRPGLRARQYCSQQCYLSRPRPEKKTGSVVPCAQCGAQLYREANHLARGNAHHFCNKACHDAHQARSKIIRRCTVCDAEFALSPSSAARTAGRYCSIACRNACGSWKSNAVIAANIKQIHAAGPNRLELAGRAILDQLGLAYAEQVLVDGKFVVDVRLADAPVVIQWDGDYWHGYRAPGDTRPLDARQLRRTTFDRSQDAYMHSAGLTVLRFWEHEVYKKPDEVLSRIRAAVES